jgi:ribose/xylose/arabinose/galactoside ABC-type transport system permease subunit
MLMPSNSSYRKDSPARAFFHAWAVSERGERFRRRWADHAFIIAFIILVLIAASASEVFFTPQNISNIFRQIVTNGLVSLGLLIVILTGGIDLSVGPIVALGGILAAGLQQQIPLPLAILIALSAGMMVGVVNGFLVARFKLQPFIVTLATMGIVRGVIFVYSEVPQVPSNPAFRGILAGSIGIVPVSVIIMAAGFPLVWLFLNRTTAGRAIVAVGGNEEAVRLAGIKVGRHIILAYILSGLFAAMAGVLLAARLGVVQPNLGVGFELDAIAAVVIGGGILGGGGGGAIGVFAGVLTLGLIDNLLNLFGVQTFYQQIFKGIIILFAVLVRRKK